jgi:hypothetical protein
LELLQKIVKKFGSNRTNISDTLPVVVSGNIYWTKRYVYITLNIVILLTVTCSSTANTERIVAFQLQQWLLEYDPILRNIYIVYVAGAGCNLRDGSAFSLDEKYFAG